MNNSLAAHAYTANAFLNSNSFIFGWFFIKHISWYIGLIRGASRQTVKSTLVKTAAENRGVWNLAIQDLLSGFGLRPSLKHKTQ
jgi:hypothetical protein